MEDADDGIWCAGSSSGWLALQFLKRVLEGYRAASGSFAVFDPWTKKLRILASCGLSLSRLEKSSFLPPWGIGMYVFQRAAPVILDASHAPPVPLGYRRTRDRASVCLPLRDRRKRTVGVLSLNGRDRSFEESAFAILERVEQECLKFSTFLEQIFEEESVLWAAERAFRVLERLDWAMGMHEVVRNVLRAFRMLVPSEYAVLFTLFPGEEGIAVVSRKALRLFPKAVHKDIRRALLPLFKRRRLLVCDIPEIREVLPFLPPEIPSRILVQPLLWHGRFIGAFVALVDVLPQRLLRSMLAAFSSAVAGILWGFASFERIRSCSLERERLRLAQDLHDRVAQALAGALMCWEDLKEALREGGIFGEHEGILCRLEHFLSLSCGEVRAILETLRGGRKVESDFSLEEALLQRLEYLFGLQGVHYRLKVQLPEAQLPPFVREEVFSILEECYTNVWKHAEATRLLVAVGTLRDALYLFVQDNGKGFTPGEETKENAFGLRGIRERVASLGGVVRIRSFPGKGTKVGVMFPVFW